MTNPPDECRAAFEAWNGEHANLERETWGSSRYKSVLVQTWWHAWVAGWSACAERRPEPEPAKNMEIRDMSTVALCAEMQALMEELRHRAVYGYKRETAEES